MRGFLHENIRDWFYYVRVVGAGANLLCCIKVVEWAVVPLSWLDKKGGTGSLFTML